MINHEPRRLSNQSPENIVELALYVQHFVCQNPAEQRCCELLTRIFNSTSGQYCSIYPMIKSMEMCCKGHILDQMILNLISENNCLFDDKTIYFINLSNDSLSKHQIMHTLERLKTIEGINSKFAIEISERINPELKRELLSSIETLMDMNITVAIDDYNAQLLCPEDIIRIKPHYLKLDRSLLVNWSDLKIRRHMEHFESISNLKIIAEGIDSIQLKEKAKRANVDFMQGFLFHDPQKIINWHQLMR